MFFLHVILQLVYLVSFTIIGVYFLRYQFHVVAWMLATGREVHFTPTRKSLKLAVIAAEFFLGVLGFLNWINWNWVVTEMRYGAPLMILSVIFYETNFGGFSEYDDLHYQYWDELHSSISEEHHG